MNSFALIVNGPLVLKLFQLKIGYLFFRVMILQLTVREGCRKLEHTTLGFTSFCELFRQFIYFKKKWKFFSELKCPVPIFILVS